MNNYLLQNYTRPALVMESGSGAYITDTDGNRYLDMVTGIGVNALGYGHARITAALMEQAERCLHTSNLFHHQFQEPLAERLCGMSGMDRAFFANSGTEAMEAALKAVRSYWQGRRARLLALDGGFHGRTLGSLAITGQAELRKAFEPLGSEVCFVDANDEVALREAIDGQTAALILEPVMGEAGVFPLQESYLRVARELTTRHGALLVADETQCGLGRTGKYFAYQWAGILPDVVVTAKPLAAGLPLGATLFRQSVADALPVHSHGTTFGGGPLACRVALEFLTVMDELLPRIGTLGLKMRRMLEALHRRHPIITEVRSKGMMFGIQLSRPGHDIVREALERGLVINCTHGNVLRLLPPFTLTDGEAEEAAGILDAVLMEVVQR